MADKFTLNATVSIEEGFTSELIEIREQAGKTSVVEQIRDEVDKYVVGYLNGGIEGSIYWGIRDDGKVSGVFLDTSQREAVKKAVDEKLRGIEPKIPLNAIKEPTFHVVYLDGESTRPERSLYVVEVVAPPIPDRQLRYTIYNDCYIKQGSELVELTELGLKNEIEKRKKKISEAPTTKSDDELETESVHSSFVGAIRNPYDFASQAIKDMFKGRNKEINQLLGAIRYGRHTVIFGLQRVGKTSFVEETLTEKIGQLLPYLESEVSFVNVDLHRFGGESTTCISVLEKIVSDIAEKVSPAREKRVKVEIAKRKQEYTALETHDKRKMLDDFTKILIETVRAPRRKKIVLFLDEFSELCYAIEKNEKLKRRDINRFQKAHPHEMLVDEDFMHWFSALIKRPEIRGRLVFIIAVRPFVGEYDGRKNLQLLKLMNPIKLYHLDENAAKALITEPLEGEIQYADGCVDYLYELTAGHPYLIQFLLQNVINNLPEKSRIIEKQNIVDFEETITTEGPAYAAHFNVLDSDYSVEAVTNTNYKKMGRGLLAYIARSASPQKDNWVRVDYICNVFNNFIDTDELYTLLSKLLQAGIIQQREDQNGNHVCKITIPLLQKRYNALNMVHQYFKIDNRGNMRKKF